jgi:hypothetical protein
MVTTGHYASHAALQFPEDSPDKWRRPVPDSSDSIFVAANADIELRAGRDANAIALGESVCAISASCALAVYPDTESNCHCAGSAGGVWTQIGRVPGGVRLARLRVLCAGGGCSKVA